MHKQLLLFHNAVSAYFSGNQTALEATLKQFNIKMKTGNVAPSSWLEQQWDVSRISLNQPKIEETTVTFVFTCSPELLGSIFFSSYIESPYPLVTHDIHFSTLSQFFCQINLGIGQGYYP